MVTARLFAGLGLWMRSVSVLPSTGIRDKISTINLVRIYRAVYALIPIHLAHVVIFALNLEGAAGNTYIWRWGIIWAHFLMCFLMATAGFVAYRFQRKSLPHPRLTHALAVVLGGMYLLFGAVVASIDQLVTTSITPLIVASIAVAVGFLIKPLLAGMGYLIMYGLFCWLVGFTQPDPEVLLSLRVNAITITGVGFFVSYLLWQYTITNLGYQAKLEANARELAENNALKDRLFAVVSHDIRDPLAVLVSLTDLLAEERDNLSPESAEIITLVQERISHTYNLVENLLDWFKARIHNLDLCLYEINLDQASQKVLEDCRIRAADKAITIISEIPQELKARTSPYVLEVLLRNLVGNAIKFTSSGGLVRVKASVSGDSILVSVSDTGVGIGPERVKTLFAEGSAYESSLGTSGEKGTGFGLLICKELVEKIGGKIWAESSSGYGSTFFFTVPVLSSGVKQCR